MRILYFLLVLFSTDSFSTCIDRITRTDVGFQAVLTSQKYNSDVNTAYNHINNLPGDCIQEETIKNSKFVDNSIQGSKIKNGTITKEKLATSAVPESGRLLRIKSFTTSGTWTKSSDVGSVFVQLVGGGGTHYHSSATSSSGSSFGSHCTANGGGNAPTGIGKGIGGTASGGDINIKGSDGGVGSTLGSFTQGIGGVSMIGYFGQGGESVTANSSGGGGAGGYCAKLIRSENLNSSESVTVGQGGTTTDSLGNNGRNGIVLVYEYSN